MSPAREVGIGDVSGLFLCPAGAHALYVLAHGAGAGMRHSFMEAISQRLAERGVATLRYQFVYMERGAARPDAPKRAVATIRAAVARARELADGLPLYAGGKSFGGRMTSTAQSEAPLAEVQGLIFLGFPLHAAKKPDTKRAEHLAKIEVPMLFLQGTRDTLADLDRLQPIVRAHPTAELHVVEGGDHSFHVLKRSGRTDAEALDELASRIARFTDR